MDRVFNHLFGCQLKVALPILITPIENGSYQNGDKHVSVFLPICNKGVRIQSQRGLKEMYQPRSSIGVEGELG